MVVAPAGISVFVRGTPVTKGSLRQWHRFDPAGRCLLGISEQSGPKLAEWRALIATAAKRSMRHEPPISGPVKVSLTFLFERPKANRDASTFVWGNKRWDVDKLARAVFDALTDAAVVWDDSQIAKVEAMKRWCDGLEHPGVQIEVGAL